MSNKHDETRDSVLSIRNLLTQELEKNHFNIEGSGYNLLNGESDLTVYYAGQYYDIRIANITDAFKDVKKKAVGDA
jgi:hypothetical protein|tara:strand:+ start:21 stop:248 length:228 start_codon:yes stop_codon:yes gene_type:complete